MQLRAVKSDATHHDIDTALKWQQRDVDLITNSQGASHAHRSVTPKFVTPTAPWYIDNSWRSTTLPGTDSASSNQTLSFQNEHEWDSEWYSFNYYLYTIEQWALRTWVCCSYAHAQRSRATSGCWLWGNCSHYNGTALLFPYDIIRNIHSKGLLWSRLTDRLRVCSGSCIL